jgi:hypothetical protein
MSKLNCHLGKPSCRWRMLHDLHMRRVVDYFSLRRLVFGPCPVRVGIVVDKVAMGPVPLKVRRFCPDSIIILKNPHSFICLSPTVFNGGKCQSR